MNNLLSIALPTTFGETIFLGAQVVLIGIATVFAVLILIMGILTVFKTMLGGEKKAEQKPTVAAAPAPVVVAPVQSDDTEIVAVIAAAIAMAESESFGGKFRVVSFKRK